MSIYNYKEYKNLRKSLRNNLPPAEKILWTQLKDKKLSGYKFRRQHGIGPFVVDFYCPSKRLVIEVDGASHYQEGADKYDESRGIYIKKNDIKIIRFTNTDIYKNLDTVLREISDMLKEDR